MDNSEPRRKTNAELITDPIIERINTTLNQNVLPSMTFRDAADIGARLITARRILDNSSEITAQSFTVTDNDKE